jgi:acetyl esterase/lipase
MPIVIRLRGSTRRYASAQAAREHIEERALRPQPYGPPPRLRSDVTVSAARRAGWPIYTVAPRSCAPERTVVYLHGGAWVNEIVPQHWQLVSQLAAEARVRVVVPIYPLLPFASAAEVVPGDSAGGQLALAAALILRDDHDVVLPRTVLISPFVDASLTNPLIAAVDPTDPWLSREGALVFSDRWRADLALTDPRVSPLAADLAGLGPLTVFSGTRDILNPDARLLTEKATAAGVDVDYHECRGVLHVYPLTPTPEGRAARAVIVKQLAAR